MTGMAARHPVLHHFRPMGDRANSPFPPLPRISRFAHLHALLRAKYLSSTQPRTHATILLTRTRCLASADTDTAAYWEKKDLSAPVRIAWHKAGVKSRCPSTGSTRGPRIWDSTFLLLSTETASNSTQPVATTHLETSPKAPNRSGKGQPRARRVPRLGLGSRDQLLAQHYDPRTGLPIFKVATALPSLYPLLLLERLASFLLCGDVGWSPRSLRACCTAKWLVLRYRVLALEKRLILTWTAYREGLWPAVALFCRMNALPLLLHLTLRKWMHLLSVQSRCHSTTSFEMY
ncbi:uncharacterized protein BKA78DRAFT_320934 [Phyllosticta capitalensis]|uniref:uncharacterized protein n=1 Tax=Phyllosticta capitalensis TaxID=121624 RepID=UPI00313182A7